MKNIGKGRGPKKWERHWEREPGDVPNVPQATPRTFALGDSIVWLWKITKR